MELEIILVIVGCVVFFGLILGFFAWYFIAMNREDTKGKAQQDKIYKSRFLKFLAGSFGRGGGRSKFFPNTFGGRMWK